MTDEQPYRIQIVEDEGLITESLRQILTDHGYQVVGTASKEEEAIRTARRESPDLVLMDLRLDDGDSGIRAARTIQDELDATVLYLTAHKNGSKTEKANETDHAGFITKPITDSGLVSAVQRALKDDGLL